MLAHILVIALTGPLGAGKTRLVQAVAVASGVDRREVVSPTFVLVHEYHGSRPIYHLDAYRLRDDDEFLELGADEYFGPPNLVFIEWADRVRRCLPPERIDELFRENARAQYEDELLFSTGLIPIRDELVLH